jgi:drug/metabolite transporter (DMT)-like permease
VGVVLDPDPNAAARGRRLVLAAALFWSIGGAATKLLLAPNLGPMAIAFYRSLFAGLVLLPFVPRGRWVVRPRMFLCAAVFGVMIAVYIAAVHATTAANAIFLQFTGILWSVPLSALVLRERPQRRELIGIAVASVGIVAIVSHGYVGKPGEGMGIIYGLASGFCYGLLGVLLRWLRDLDSIWLSAFNNLSGALGLGVAMWLWSAPPPLPAARVGIALVAFGAFQMAIPYTLYARGLRDIGAPEAGLITLLEPVLNPIWVLLLVHERPAPASIAGGLFLLAGVACRYWPTPRRH